MLLSAAVLLVVVTIVSLCEGFFGGLSLKNPRQSCYRIIADLLAVSDVTDDIIGKRKDGTLIFNRDRSVYYGNM